MSWDLKLQPPAPPSRERDCDGCGLTKRVVFLAVGPQRGRRLCRKCLERAMRLEANE